MKKLLAIFSVLSLCMAMLTPLNVSAVEKTKGAVAKLTNEETGVEKEFEVNVVGIAPADLGNTYYVTYEAIADISDVTDLPQPMSEEEGVTKTKNEVKATVTIKYSFNGNNGDIRFENMRGSWTALSSLMMISNKSVGCTEDKHTWRSNPSGLSYSQTFNWGWVPWKPASSISGARGWHDCVIEVAGMSATRSKFEILFNVNP